VEWLGTLALTLLAAYICPAFDLLDFGPNDPDPNDWSTAALVAIQPVAPAKLARILDFAPRPSGGLNSAIVVSLEAAKNSQTIRSHPALGFPVRYSRNGPHIPHQGRSHLTVTSNESAADPA
jgi:hypothetical protein